MLFLYPPALADSTRRKIFFQAGEAIYFFSLLRLFAQFCVLLAEEFPPGTCIIPFFFLGVGRRGLLYNSGGLGLPPPPKSALQSEDVQAVPHAMAFVLFWHALPPTLSFGR